MKISRRGLFGLVAAAAVTPFVPMSAVSLAVPLDGIRAVIASTPTIGTVAGINRATFSFWRNQDALHSAEDFHQLAIAMREPFQRDEWMTQ